jgi:putative spermidine/putrescine transport system permease protein
MGAKVGKRIAGNTVTLLGIILLGLFILAPLIVLVIYAFAKAWFFPALLPQQWSFYWWGNVLSDGHFGHSVLLSFMFAPVVTLVSAVICLPAAYAFARYNFPLRRVFLVSLFAINAFPKMGLYIAMATLLYALHLMSTFVGVVIVQMLNTIVVMTWIPTAAFAGVPKALEEAARDAGAGPIQTFFRITLPVALPGILVALILSFLASLDEAQGTFLVGAPNFITMPTLMYTLVNGYPIQAAAVFSILLAIPSVALLLLVRRYVTGGTLAAGFKLR